jgi:predicted Rossmann fold flavoprotein
MSMNTIPRTPAIWDVVVIGGGPAGMMAAGRAAERGRSVLLLEKNGSLGKKLLITGGGRCNVTNNTPDMRTMLANYKKSERFLYSAFAQFGVDDALAFFHQRGMATKEEANGRMFPVSDQAQSVWDVLVGYMREHGVRVATGFAVTGIFFDNDTKKFRVAVQNGQVIVSLSVIVATGGLSRPETGSTGEGFGWLKKLGHTIIANNVALVPVALRDEWVKALSGVVLQDVKMTLFQNGKKQNVRTGKILFTHFGISGPTILNMSKEIGEMLQYGEVTVAVDLFPQFDHGQLKEEIKRLLAREPNRLLKNTLKKMIAPALVSTVLALAKVDIDTPNHSITREDRIRLIALLKAIPLHVSGLLGADKAVISSGGVSLSEIDFKTMQSRLIPNLYIVGDVLHIDRPSGGYSLQLCWTTGFVAGSHC